MLALFSEHSAPFEYLGVPLSADRKAIRQAYSRRAKEIRPDESPEEFQRLREAYEYALTHAEDAPEPVAEVQVSGWVPRSAGTPAADLNRFELQDFASPESVRTPPPDWDRHAPEPLFPHDAPPEAAALDALRARLLVALDPSAPQQDQLLPLTHEMWALAEAERLQTQLEVRDWLINLAGQHEGSTSAWRAQVARRYGLEPPDDESVAEELLPVATPGQSQHAELDLIRWRLSDLRFLRLYRESASAPHGAAASVLEGAGRVKAWWNSIDKGRRDQVNRVLDWMQANAPEKIDPVFQARWNKLTRFAPWGLFGPLGLWVLGYLGCLLTFITMRAPAHAGTLVLSMVLPTVTLVGLSWFFGSGRFLIQARLNERAVRRLEWVEVLAVIGLILSCVFGAEVNSELKTHSPVLWWAGKLLIWSSATVFLFVSVGTGRASTLISGRDGALGVLGLILAALAGIYVASGLRFAAVQLMAAFALTTIGVAAAAWYRRGEAVLRRDGNVLLNNRHLAVLLLLILQCLHVLAVAYCAAFSPETALTAFALSGVVLLFAHMLVIGPLLLANQFGWFFLLLLASLVQVFAKSLQVHLHWAAWIALDMVLIGQAAYDRYEAAKKVG